MESFDHRNPDALLAAYVELAADILGEDTSAINVDVRIDVILTSSRHWRQFSSASLKLAQVSSEEAVALMGASCADVCDREWWVEMRSLSTLAAFSEPARKLHEKRQERLETPTLRSLAATYASQEFHPSGIASKLFTPKSRKAVLSMGLIVTLTIPVVSAVFVWWSCPISEYGCWKNFFLMSFFLGFCSVSYFGIYLAWGLRSLRRDAKPSLVN